MITVTTVDGRKYAIKPSIYYKNAKELIEFLTTKTVTQVNYMISTRGTYILSKYIVTARDD